MSIGRIVSYCAAFAFSITVSGAALADPTESGPTYRDLCPPSHGTAGSGYRDMSVRFATEIASVPRTQGVAVAGGYRDSLERFSRAERTGPVYSPNKIVGGGYRDSLARFPNAEVRESPRHAMLRCGRLESF